MSTSKMSNGTVESSHIEIDTDNTSDNTPSEKDALNTSTIEAEGSSLHMDIDAVIQGFKECLKDDSLNVDGYLRAYAEMTKFFEVLGSVFTFVVSDVVSKTNILRCYRKGGSAEYYATIQSLLQYEKDQPSLTQPSAARTLLRLHRALPFVSEFLREINKADMETKTGPIAQPIYARTLAPYHGWFISKTVSAVMLLLPFKKTILDRLVGDDVAKQRYLETVIPELVTVMDKVYQATQNFYTEYEMLDLP